MGALIDFDFLTESLVVSSMLTSGRELTFLNLRADNGWEELSVILVLAAVLGEDATRRTRVMRNLETDNLVLVSAMVLDHSTLLQFLAIVGDESMGIP